MSFPADSAAGRSPPGRVRTPLAAADLAGYDAIIDARSPGEFAEDHLPGAINLPVLDDAERALVGTAHAEQGAFAAKRIGAPLVSANIARHLAGALADRPRTWRPLVYCWRGGSRSGSLTHVLRQVGWDAVQLDGGYKAFRRQVSADLAELPCRFAYRVVCGATGSGKSRLLEALARAGAQVLDLEQLARHRGSVLGDLPGDSQPTQKAFETLLWHALSGLDTGREVFVESESRKVGNLRVPDSLIERMRSSPCLRLEAPQAVRIALLMEDYAHLIADAALLHGKLRCLTPLHGHARIAEWEALADKGDHHRLVAELLEQHYDPAYQRSMARNYTGLATAQPLPVTSAGAQAFDALARALAQAA